jgi:SPX domain protein involved in polyphosphate accumulation
LGKIQKIRFNVVIKKKLKNTFQNFYTRTKVKIPGGKKVMGGGKENFSLFETHGLTSPLYNKP